jgi:hypothetical protein
MEICKNLGILWIITGLWWKYEGIQTDLRLFNGNMEEY